jgi:hypothetical protein
MNSTFSGVRQGGFGATRKAEEATLPPSGLLNEPSGSTGGDRNLECRDEPRLGEKSSALEQDRYSLVSMSDTGLCHAGRVLLRRLGDLVLQVPGHMITAELA